MILRSRQNGSKHHRQNPIKVTARCSRHSATFRQIIDIAAATPAIQSSLNSENALAKRPYALSSIPAPRSNRVPLYTAAGDIGSRFS